MHFSAIYFVPDYLQPNIRAIFWPNPVLHGVSWFRHAFYPTYPNVLNNHEYLILISLILLPIGLLMVQMLEHRDEINEIGAVA